MGFVVLNVMRNQIMQYLLYYTHTLPSVNQKAYKIQTLRHINLLTMFPIFKAIVKFCILLTFQTNLTPYFSKSQ